MLTSRGRRILYALISEYVATGEPVSSGSLAKESDIDLSSASIRAVLAELEGLGFLKKPHTSAGRVPTDKAFRAFVDALVRSSELPTEVLEAIEARYAGIDPGLEATVRHTGKVLAELTGAAAVVMTSPGARWKLKDLRFIPIRSGEVLVVLVGMNGGVQNHVVRVDERVTSAEIERANNLLQTLLGSRSLLELRRMLSDQLASERARLDQHLRLALTLGASALSQIDDDGDVVVAGQAQLIGRPEFADIDRARHALRTLADTEHLVRLLDRTLAAPGIQVVLGSDDEAMEAGELSMVAAPFASGSIGVIGSTRMDYPNVVSVVRSTAQLLTRLLRPEEDPDRKRD